MDKRPSRKGQTDNYFEARKALGTQRFKDSAHAWLEVIEGAEPDTVNYVLHASSNAAHVPPFAVEYYKDGRLQSYEVSQSRLLELSVMPEEVRAGMVRAQTATSAIEAPANAKSLALS